MKTFSGCNKVSNEYENLNAILLSNKQKIARITKLISKITYLYQKTSSIEDSVDMFYKTELKQYEDELLELSESINQTH